MKLGVYSLQKVLYQGDASSVTCVTRAGEITILDHHEPLISMLAKGTIKVTDGAKKDSYIPVVSGFLEVRPGNQVKILVDSDKKENV